VGPTLRRPTGAYLHEATAASASAGLFTMGMITPPAPRSSILPMIPGSFHVTRASGTLLPSSIAWNIASASA